MVKCRECKELFAPATKWRKLCPECFKDIRRKAALKVLGQLQGREWPTQDRQCNVCGETFQVPTGGRGSQALRCLLHRRWGGSGDREQRRKYSRAWGLAHREERREYNREWQAAHRKTEPFRPAATTCALCGESFLAEHLGQRYCIKAHAAITERKRRWARQKRKMDADPGYAAKVKGRVNAAYHVWRVRAEANGTDGRSRAERYGCEWENVDVLAVFERDGWRCQICGRKTPRSRRGTNHNNAPGLDHRIPLKRGGGHTYGNVQCACRACNRDKGAWRTAGQLPIWKMGFGGSRPATAIGRA